MKPVFLTQVPITAAQLTRSGRSWASCTAISEPIESPARATGGEQTASIRSARSAAWASIGQGGSELETVAPTPRAS